MSLIVGCCVIGKNPAPQAVMGHFSGRGSVIFKDGFLLPILLSTLKSLDFLGTTLNGG